MKQEMNRRFEKFLEPYGWEEVEFANLIAGDIFKIYQRGNRYITKEGDSMWIVREGYNRHTKEIIAEPYIM